jgi:hypothetical protein
MALTYTITHPVGGTTNFTINFPYIDTSNVKVEINGVAVTAFTFNGGATEVILDVATTAGDAVKVYRQTAGRVEGDAALLVDFVDGSILSETDLDKATQQLLYLTQEAEENGVANLPLDWEGNYNAQQKRITNLSGSISNDSDAVYKGYVDAIALYGGSVGIPQAWAKLQADFTVVGATTDYEIVLTNEVPSSDNEYLYIVAIDGVLQRPATDFILTEVNGTFTLKMLGWTDYATSTVISIQNFGVSRSVLKQPFTADTSADVGLTVKRKNTDVSHADLQQWTSDADVKLAGVDKDGAATFAGLTTTGTGATAFGGTLGAVGAADFDSTLNVDGASTLNTTSSTDLTATNSLTVGTGTDKVTVDVSGNTDITTGTLDVGGATTCDATLDVAGDTTLTGDLEVGGQITTAGTGGLYTEGSIVQVQHLSFSTNTATASVEADNVEITGFELAITPKHANSKMLIQVQWFGHTTHGAEGNDYGAAAIMFGIKRDSTVLASNLGRPMSPVDAHNDYDFPTTDILVESSSFTYLDLPASVSEQTYKVIASQDATGASTVRTNAGDASGNFPSISTITIMEIAGSTS